MYYQVSAEISPPPPVSVMILIYMYCNIRHFKVFSILIIGRLLGGVATSLLFSVFDAWMVSEHNKRGYDPEWLSETFSSASFGNSVVAILAGIVAQVNSSIRKCDIFNC